jgi:hypothetical protein
MDAIHFQKAICPECSQPAGLKLITQSPSEQGVIEEPKTPTYLAAKRFLFELEATGTLTLQMAQACILLTIYELGHAIFPAAYISVGICSRYVMAHGINGKKTPHTTDAAEWMKQEEKTRVWWSTVILDKYETLLHTKCHL